MTAQPRLWIEATTIGDLVDRAAAEVDGDALVFPDGRATYAELAVASDTWARALCAWGVGPGDTVGILMPNCLDFAVAFVATAKLGAVAVPVNARFKAHELAHVIGHADIRVLVAAAGPEGTVDFPALLADVFADAAEQDPRALRLAGAPALRQIVHANGARPGQLTREVFLARAAEVEIDEVRILQQRVRIRDVAMLMYTSGTTARPKGCLLTHESLVRHGATVIRDRFRMTADDRFWDALPLFHIGGITPMLGCIGARAAFCHAGHFDPAVSLRMLQEERITVAYPAFDLIWLAILGHPDYAAADLSRIRLVMSITTPERLRDLQRRTPHAAYVTSFGATECSSHLTLPLPDALEEVRMSTLGPVVPGMEMRIVDPETGWICEPGEVGEILFRGYARFEGYYKEPELTAQAIDADGWFHTQDLGAIREDGNLLYSGRLKDMLKVGGENVAAIEIEDYLVRHPAVNIAVVTGVRDARYDEVPAAFVQLAPGATLTQEELIAFCVGRIATFKVPRYLRLRDEWPMSGTKIQKFVLREELETELDAAGIEEAPRIDSRSPAS
ncbi:MAG: AMP-binding protein [Actinobacteria bacterium]|nr:AMP-binding protein [Actinomycetota bacterium]